MQQCVPRACDFHCKTTLYLPLLEGVCGEIPTVDHRRSPQASQTTAFSERRQGLGQPTQLEIEVRNAIMRGQIRQHGQGRAAGTSRPAGCKPRSSLESWPLNRKKRSVSTRVRRCSSTALPASSYGASSAMVMPPASSSLARIWARSKASFMFVRPASPPTTSWRVRRSRTRDRSRRGWPLSNWFRPALTGPRGKSLFVSAYRINAGMGKTATAGNLADRQPAG